MGEFVRSFNFELLRNNVISDVDCRLVKHRGRFCNDDYYFYEEKEMINIDGYALVKNKVFYNIQFDSNKFDKFRFEGCSFKDCVFKNGSFDNVVFYKCDFEYGVFKSFIFESLTFEQCKLKGTVFLECSFRHFSICDCDCRSFKLASCEVFNFEFNDSLITKFDEDTFFDEAIRFDNLDRSNKISFYEDSCRFYKTLAYKFQQNNLLNLYGEYYYLSKVMEKETLKGLTKLKSSALWLICGYGERPTYALITSLEIIFIFTVLYMIFGLRYGNDVISYKEIFLEAKSFNFAFNDFITAFHFSIVTFTTVGYGDVTPIGYSILLSGIEMFLGVTMVGLWTATLARKISR